MHVKCAVSLVCIALGAGIATQWMKTWRKRWSALLSQICHGWAMRPCQSLHLLLHFSALPVLFIYVVCSLEFSLFVMMRSHSPGVLKAVDGKNRDLCVLGLLLVFHSLSLCWNSFCTPVTEVVPVTISNKKVGCIYALWFTSMLLVIAF